MKLLLPTTAVLISLPTAFAWGTLGHQTVAYIASNFVQPTTKDFFQNIIHNDTDSYLAMVATWADSFRYTAAGRFSAPFHFIDAEDDPPLSCSVKYTRDCGVTGCIIGAINNYTTQLLEPSTNPWMQNMAAKFIIHVRNSLLCCSRCTKDGSSLATSTNPSTMKLFPSAATPSKFSSTA
jgi:hypothetical protein